jgi:hypothetical protein
MYKSIILSSCMFGSVFLCSTSLLIINKYLLENRKMPFGLIIINGLTFVISGSVFIYSIGYSINLLK